MYSNSRYQSILKQGLHSCWNLFPFPDSSAIRFQRFWLSQTWREGGPKRFGFCQHVGWQVQIVWASENTPASRSDSFFPRKNNVDGRSNGSDLLAAMFLVGLTIWTCRTLCWWKVKWLEPAIKIVDTNQKVFYLLPKSAKPTIKNFSSFRKVRN